MKKMNVLKKIMAVLFPVAAAVALTVSCEQVQGPEMKIGKTVLIYMAADNDLESFARKNLEDIKNGYLPEFFNEGKGDVLLVYTDIRGETPKLIRLSAGRPGEVYEEVLVEYEEDQNSMSDSVMSAVLSYAAELFPSENAGLVLWSHGTGWLPEGYYSNPVSMSDDGMVIPMSVEEDPFAAYVKSFGSDGSSEMDIKTLAEALPMRYSYIVFDACLMGGVEVAYEVREKCDYFLGSAAEILAEGMPYASITEDLMKGDRQALESVCRKYYEHYIDDGATIALVDTRSLERLATACADIAASGRDAVASLDMSSIQGYFRRNKHWFYDLGDLMSRLATPEQYSTFTSALEAAVPYRLSTEEFRIGGHNQFDIKTFSGLSTYVPNPENSYLDDFYRTLAWNQAVRMVR